MTFLFACAVSLAVALAGWRLRSLTAPGALAAAAVGTAILHGTGLPGMLALGAFFVPSTLLSHYSPDPGRALDTKGATRDHWQVLANGAAAAIGALLPGSGLWIVTASLAAAAADTWATSVGGWSRRSPRNILTLRPVPAGTSGGITALGSAGGVFGAIVVGLGPAVVTRDVRLLTLGLIIGGLGMMADSLLGATLQGKFHCDRCDLATERRVHRCGQPSRRTAGCPWLGNDGVNGLATAAAAVAGWLAWRCWGP